MSLLAALVLAATWAPGAEGAARWAIEGKTLAESGIEKESLSGAEGALSLEVPALGFTLVCTTDKASGHIAGTSKGDATFELTGCSVKAKTETLPCTVEEPVTVTAESEFVEHEGGVVYNILKSKGEAPLATIGLSGEKCSLASKTKLTGTTAGELQLGESLDRNQAFSKGIAEAAKTSLKYGTQTAYFNGSTVEALSGVKSGEEWGAGTRTALLCEMEADLCPSSAVYPAHTAISASLEAGTEALFKGGFGTVQCAGSEIEGETLEEEGEDLLGTVGELSFSSCTLSGTACTLTTEHRPYSTSLAYANLDEGTLTMSSKGEAPAVQIGCGKVLSCTVSGNLGLSFEGGEPGHIAAAGALFSSPKEGTCSKSTLTATYEMHGPGGGVAFVAQQQAGGGTKLCSQAPTLNAQTGRLKCAAGQGYAGEVVKGELSAGMVEFFYNPGGVSLKEILCNEATFEGKFKEDGGAVTGKGLTALTFSSLVGGVPGKPCASNNLEAGNPSVTITVLNLPYTASSIVYTRRASGRGDLLARSATAGEMKIRMEVNNNNPPATCTYVDRYDRMAAFWYNGAGANSSLLNPLATNWTKEAGGAAVCPPSLTMTAVLTAKNGTNGNLYVAGE